VAPEEAHDFNRLCDTLTRNHPAQEASWVVFLAAGIVLGFMLASLSSIPSPELSRLAFPVQVKSKL